MKVSNNAISFILNELVAKKSVRRFSVVDVPSPEEIELIIQFLVGWVQTDKKIDISEYLS